MINGSSLNETFYDFFFFFGTCYLSFISDSDLLCFFSLCRRWNGLLPCHGELHRPCHHVLLLWPLCSRATLPEVFVVEKIHDRHSAGTHPSPHVLSQGRHRAAPRARLTFNAIVPPTDPVCARVSSRNPVLLHGPLRLPVPHNHPPCLDVRNLLLRALLQLLGAGLREG